MNVPRKTSNQAPHNVSLTSENFIPSRDTESDVPTRHKDSLNVSKSSEPYSDKGGFNNKLPLYERKNYNDFIITHKDSTASLEKNPHINYLGGLYEFIPGQGQQKREQDQVRGSRTPDFSFSKQNNLGSIANLSK